MSGDRLWRDRDRAALGLVTAVADAALSGDDEAAALAAAVPTHAPGAGCLVHRFDEDHRTLGCVAASAPFEPAVGALRIPLGDGVAGWVASRVRAARVADRRTDPRGDHLDALGPAVAECSAGLAAPIPRRGGYVGGAVEIYRRAPLRHDAGDARVLARAAALLRDARQRDGPSDRYARTVEQAQEAERSRLAADIHDGITQRLASLGFHLSAAAAAGHDEPAFVADELAAAQHLCDLLVGETRAAIRDLGPPQLDELGLPGALAQLARQTAGVRARLRVDGDAGADLPRYAQTALYRICQEALHNVVAHAGACRADLELVAATGAVSLSVRDDGRGLPADTGLGPGTPSGDRGLGLAGMRDRAESLGGSLDLEPTPGRGTTVRVTVPRTR